MQKENNSDKCDFSENEIPDLNSLKPFEFEPKLNMEEGAEYKVKRISNNESCEVLLRLVFLDNEYSSEVLQILFTAHYFSNVAPKSRSSRPEVFCKKGDFENFANQKCFPVNFSKFSRTSSVKKMFLDILLNPQENTCARVSFLQP